MVGIDGKITIESGLRPCTVHIPASHATYTRADGSLGIDTEEPKTYKALFHGWHPVTGKAIVENEDGTIHEVEPTHIRFVDNAMSEYVFPEDKGEKEKAFDVLRGICPECGGNMRIDEGIFLTGLPLLYTHKCDKCGHIEYSGSERV